MTSFFQTITSLFSSNRGDGLSNISRRDQTMHSTDAAFSLPTHSPSRLGPDSPHPSYTYPPAPLTPSSAYDFVPQSAGYTNTATFDMRRSNSLNTNTPTSPTSAGYTATFTRSRPNSLLPLHNAQLSPLPPYPPPANTWNRLRTWLSNEYPELGDSLNWGILPTDLAQIELNFGFPLPAAVRDSYLAVDGQEPESAGEGLFFGLTMLPLEDVLEEWKFWREVEEDPTTGANPRLREHMQSIPSGYIRREYTTRGWIPLVTDRAGNYLGIDVTPDESGTPGQVIVFGRDFDTKVVMWRGEGEGGWARWLAGFVEDLENGEGFEIGPGQDQSSDDSEDSIGYESYFFDSGGQNKGEGGGDRGTGGLRLTGEYKGWNVLEAWADRSVKKWREAGLVPPEADDVASSSKRDRAKARMSTLPEASVEVPIPVLADTNSDTAPERSKQKPLPPTISITRPAPPQPLSLPTASDILPSPTSSRPTTPVDDIERGLPMSEVRTSTDTPVQSRRVSADAAKVGLLREASLTSPTREDPSTPTRNFSLTKPGTPPTTITDNTDLLSTDPAPTLVTAIPLSTSPSSSSVATPTEYTYRGQDLAPQTSGGPSATKRSESPAHGKQDSQGSLGSSQETEKEAKVAA